MAVKHLDCLIQSEGERRPHNQQVYFPDNSFRSSSGNTYRLGQFLVKGNNGTIFRCHTQDGQEFAVKFLHYLDQQRKERFDFELQILNDLNHENILPLIDSGQIETTAIEPIPYLITNIYITNIEKHVQLGNIKDYRQVIQYSKQICNALQYIHSQGIIHRDLKASNYFISSDDHIVMGDFGLAKTITTEGITREYGGDITRVGEFVGPILWMSPELAKYAVDKTYPVDHRSDLFQFGLVIWFMLTKEIPRGFIDENDDPSGGRVYELVKKLLQQKPDKRFQSASDVLSILDTIV